MGAFINFCGRRYPLSAASPHKVENKHASSPLSLCDFKMGNKIARRREMVDDRYTRPQGLYQLKDIDHKKLRKLILDSKLAPCYPGLDDCALDLDECPICFLNYPRLNRSRCCRKMICTECFLQIRPSRSSKPTKCPFCKTANYVVEYRGVRTKEEKRMEQVEEQKVIEAQIRMRRQELRDEEERIQERKHMSFSNRTISPAGVEVPYWSNISQADELISSQGSCSESASRWHSSSRRSREYTFNLDMDMDMDMVLFFDVPLWDHRIQKNASSSGRNFPQRLSSQYCYSLPVISPVVASPSSGLACSAALAEHQHMNEDSAISTAPVYNMVCSSCSSPARIHSEVGNYPPGNWTEALSNGKASPRESYEWRTNHETSRGLSYTSSNVTVDTQSVVGASHLLTDSFEEQMMLAMQSFKQG